MKPNNYVRKLILDTVYENKCGHLGGPLSCVDILTELYFKQMNINPKINNWKDRDRFILSKGHASIALYSTLALRGYFPIDELKTFDKIDSRLQAHPDMSSLDCLDFSTGSLGQGISGAVGIALSAKLKREKFNTYCLLGDGEMQEGQVWEAIDFANRYFLDNLYLIIDYNLFSQSQYYPITDIYRKLESFGCYVYSLDGHSTEALDEAFKSAKEIKNKVKVLVCHTIKGKGISFMENKMEWHSKIPTEKEYLMALEELNNA